MGKWGAVLVVGCLAVMAGAVGAQDDLSDLRQKVERLEAALRANEHERAADKSEIRELRGRLDSLESGEAIDQRLEVMINDLTQDDLPIRTSVSPFGDIVKSLTFYGEARVRAAYANNLVTLDSDLDDEGPYADGRFRLGMDLRFEENVRVVFDIQAVGRFNNNAVNENFQQGGASAVAVVGNEIVDPLDDIRLYQGFLELGDLFGLGDRSFIRAGRQELIYGNQFLLGSDDFFAGLTHDSIRVDLDFEEVRLSAFYAEEADPIDRLNSGINGLGPTPSKDKEFLAGLYAFIEPESFDPVKLEFYWVFFESRDDFQLGSTTFGTNFIADRTFPQLIFGRFHTLGLRVHLGDEALRDGLKYNEESYWLSVEFAYQTGDGLQNFVSQGPLGFQFLGNEGDIDAFAVEVFGSYRFDGDSKFTLHGGFRYAEGGKEIGNNLQPSGEIGFSPLFAGTHGTWASRFGNMDQFPLSNIFLGKFGVTFWPGENVQAGATFIGGWLDNEEYDLYRDSTYGYELDLFLNWEYSANVLLSANLSLFFPDDNLKKGGRNAAGLTVFPTYRTFSDDNVATLFYLQAQVRF